MKTINRRMVPSQFRPFSGWVEPQPFTPQCILWRQNLPGLRALGALRQLLRLAGAEFVENRFPYRRTADALLAQQMALFSDAPCTQTRCPGAARRWGQAVWLDWRIRPHLPSGGVKDFPPAARYQECVRFSAHMGLTPGELPATLDEFEVWAEVGLMARTPGSCRALALGCLSELSPLFWPVNIALLLALLPDDFWGRFGEPLGENGMALAVAGGRALDELSAS